MWFYRLLLHLFPASFRTEYGDEMCAIFWRRRQEASGVIGVIAVWVNAIADVPIEAIGAHWDVLRQDLRYTARMLAKSRGFVLTVLTVTALGIGANTAVFSLADHVLLTPLPFLDSGRLVEIWENQPPYNEMDPSPANYRDWKTASRSFQTMSAYRGLSLNLSGQGDPVRLDGAAMSADMLPMLGVVPIEGRIFTEEDDRETSPGTMLLSFSLWQSQFGGDPNVLGRTVRLDGKAYTIIGIMPSTFRFPRRDAQFWTPMRFAPGDFVDRNDNYLHVIAKLRPDVPIERARVEMTGIAVQLRQAYPRENAHTGITIVGLQTAAVSAQLRTAIWALMGAAICVLLTACANLSSLLLSRAMARRKEIAVRTALGAGHERLVRQVLTESFVLTAGGGAAGILLGAAVMPVLARLVPQSLPAADVAPVNLHVLMFAVLLTTMTALAFGVAPAVHIMRQPDFQGLREGSRSGVGGRRGRVRQALIVTEVSLSLALLISSGLLFRAMLQLRSVDPGFRSENLLTLRTVLPMPKYQNTAVRAAFYNRVLDAIIRTPGVSGAAYITALPMDLMAGIWPVNIDGQPEDPSRSHSAILRFVTPGFFDLLKIPLRQGRDVKESDTADTPFVAAVSESFGKRYWPGQDPVGRHFKFAFSEREVVGVVGDIRERGLERTSEPQVYVPYNQVRDGALVWYSPKDLVVRSSSNGVAVFSELRRIVHETDPELPISDMLLLSEIVDRQTTPRRVQLAMLGTFASVALLLAGVGIYGLLALSVSQRVQEIGVRRALGAGSSNILGVILGETFCLTAIGIAMGAALAYVGAKLMSSLLAGIHPADLPTFVIAIAVSFVTALIGGLLPAIRAIHVDPLVTMRSE